MKIDFDNYEYKEIVKDILNNREFKKIELCPHHKINRLVHSKRVSYYSYKICKKLGFDYVSAARGGLLHDFFLNKYKIITNKNKMSIIKSFNTMIITFLFLTKKSGFIHFILIFFLAFHLFLGIL